MEAGRAPGVAVAGGGPAPLGVTVHAWSPEKGADRDPGGQGLASVLPLVGTMPCVKLLGVEVRMLGDKVLRWRPGGGAQRVL